VHQDAHFGALSWLETPFWQSSRFSDTCWLPVTQIPGTWVLNLSKSRLPPPIPRSQIAHIVVNASGIQITEEIVTGAGKRMTISVKARFDGKDYPISGSPFADAVAYRRADRYTIKGAGKKDGKVIMHETVVLSLDGRTMTGTYSGTDATGKQLTAVAIFERQQ
jgi:hypothetical protein